MESCVSHAIGVQVANIEELRIWWQIWELISARWTWSPRAECKTVPDLRAAPARCGHQAGAVHLESYFFVITKRYRRLVASGFSFGMRPISVAISPSR